MESLDFDRFELSHTGLEAALKAFNLERDLTFLASLKVYGYDYRTPKKNYPYSQYIGILRLVVKKCLPTLSEAEAAVEVGRRQYDGLDQTIIGQFAMTALKAIRIERALTLVVQAMNHDSTFGKRRVIPLGIGHCLVVFNDDPGSNDNGFMLIVVIGIFSRMLEVLKAPNPHLRGYSTGPLSYEIELKWDAKPQ